MNTRLGTLALAAMLTVGAAAHAEPPALTAEVVTWLKAYDAAFDSRQVEQLTPFYHPDVTIFEGGSVDVGWAAYRDHHLGPELKEMEGLVFTHSNVSAHALGCDGLSAYVTAEYRLRARIGGRDVDTEGIETLMLVKDDGGAWKIRHSHTSSKRRPAAEPAK
ncbi:MAG: nuclear transport factor 2 family protein [Vicinamibacteria bacterium]|jgi:ketosteroid isomerase-like protein|nr:nuclear transport factor 2 family protein [Vicinamibacteria bacterium]